MMTAPASCHGRNNRKTKITRKLRAKLQLSINTVMETPSEVISRKNPRGCTPHANKHKQVTVKHKGPWNCPSSK